MDFLSYENGVGAVFMYEYVVQSLGHKCLRSNYVYKAEHPLCEACLERYERHHQQLALPPTNLIIICLPPV